MNKIIYLLKTYIFIFIFLIIYLLLISIFCYTELISFKTINIINYVFMIFLFFLLGFKYSNKIKKRGYINGFISSSILIIIFLLFSLIISKVNISSLIYYLSLILSSITGGIISSLKD
jgi:putative membrane protein (TIGR04086 family)